MALSFHLPRPAVRNAVYGSTIFLVLYILFYTTSPAETLPYLPSYFKPEPSRHPERITTPEEWDDRAEKVKAAFLHAYRGYERFAAPEDELRPVSNKPVNHYNGWGVTAFDSLDTMLLMGLRPEYQRALKIVEAANFKKSAQSNIPYFETVIRYVGGLLSAYALSGDKVLLDRSEDLVKRLDPVFDTSSGLAHYGFNSITGAHDSRSTGILAEFASLQLEYTYLAKLTGKPEHLNRSETIMNFFKNANLTKTGGMLPVTWDLNTGRPLDKHLSAGALADSTHEYLLKLYLLTSKTDKRSLEIYLRTTTQLITQLLYLSRNRKLLYVTDSYNDLTKENAIPTRIFEHLSCFLPGLLALGAHTLPLDNLESVGIRLQDLGDEKTYGNAGKAFRTLSKYNLKDVHMWAAEGIAETCYMTYADQATGLGPDEVLMDGGDASYLWIDVLERWRKQGGKGIVPGLGEKKSVKYSTEMRKNGTPSGRDYIFRKTLYLLRPETIESLYMLWKTTGNPKWREWAWDIFEAIERNAKTSSGYTMVQNVDKSPPDHGDAMPSFFLAETLKYLYLTFMNNDPISLDEWVFTTEAHPFPVFKWTPEEKLRFSIL